jgi:hypothetical protein
MTVRILPCLEDNIARAAVGDAKAYNEAKGLLASAAPDPDLPRPWRLAFIAKKRDFSARLDAAWAAAAQ